MAYKQKNAPVIVAGTGPAGMIAALAVAKAGIEVILAGPKANQSDRRTTTLMVPVLDFLSSLLPLEAILKEAAPLRTMRIIDATGRLIHSPTVSFHASEAGEQQFGFNIPNAVLNAGLEHAVEHNPAIERAECLVANWKLSNESASALLEDGRLVSAKLAVAADGRNSPAREAAGIGCRDIGYPQAALVLSFGHTRPHAFISTEFHTEHGPFTQVPLPGDRSSLVWVLPPQIAQSHAELGDQELARLVEDQMQSMLGKITLEPGRQVYPLATRIPHRFASRRVVLVGEAAHVFPPIGAQGLNLGVRDAADLQACVTGNHDDPGKASVLTAYNARRLPDIAGRAGSVHLLNRSLLSPMLPAQMARAAGLGTLGALAPIRAFAMREGLQPGSGIKGFFNDLREQIGR